jgi:hypothetical protein
LNWERLAGAISRVSGSMRQTSRVARVTDRPAEVLVWLSADMSATTLMEALKTLSEQYQGAITLTMKGREGKASQVLLQLGSANRAVMRPSRPKK